jgi:adenylate cyclase
MKYRTKLYLALAGTALVSSMSGFCVLFFEFRHHAFDDIQAKVMAVAATTAALLDPEPFKLINKRSDEDSPAYLEIKKELIKARDANRRPGIFIKFLYTLKPSSQNPEQLVFLVDAEEDPAQVSQVGDPDESSYLSNLIHHLKDYYSPSKFIPDPWGVWVSGFAPILDQSGNYVATVGADISIERYLFDIQRLLKLFSLGFLVSLLFAFTGGFFLSRRVTFALRSLLVCVREIGQGNLKRQSSLQTRDEFEELGNEINRMTQGLQERERLKLNFARYVSLHVMERILKAESVAKLEGERRKITVLFSDIRQFTYLSEQLPPEQVVSLLNEYFGTMLDVIFRYQGTLDKFLGDGIMVEFGAPLDDAMQEKHAILTAIGMQQELKRLNAKWALEKKPIIEIGVGVHTGLAVVGNIGSEKRIEYTAIGDTVNVASRLEQATKLLKKPILISETTYSAVKDEFKAESLGPMILPGRKEPIKIYSIDAESS